MTRAAVAVVALAVGAALGLALLELPVPTVRLADEVATRLAQRDPVHPVTAVLLDLRGYDTLLEVAVLLVALLGTPPAPPAEVRGDAAVDRILRAVVRPLAPLLVLVGGYLLWAGAHRAGGAFQAAAALAAAGVLLRVARVLPERGTESLAVRIAAAGGLLVFAAVALAFAARHGAMLAYPPHAAGAWMLAVEIALAPSLAAILATSFVVAGRAPCPRS